MNWSVYVILCQDGSLYTGISTDPERRFQEHRTMALTGKGKGAKYFRGKLPLETVWLMRNLDKKEASQQEAQIKRMNRRQKLEFLTGRVEL